MTYWNGPRGCGMISSLWRSAAATLATRKLAMRHFTRIAWRLLPVLLAVGCRSWEQARKDFVDPLNQFLHKDYAKAWQSNSLDQVLSF